MATIAIVGGGFCGVEVAKKLGKKHDVVLFDKKDYFEYMPSVHKMIANPDYANKIRIPYHDFLKIKLVKDEIRSITSNSILTESDSYGFDYLVICSGSTTQKPDQQNIFTLKDGEDAIKINTALKTAGEITVVGGGFTGTEIAGELATKTYKRVKLVNGTNRLLDRMHKEVGELAADYLHKWGIKMIFNKIQTQEELQREQMVIWCVGIKPNTSLFDVPKDSRGFIMVESTLQVKGLAHVFAGGDVTDTKEEKSAQNAELHGKLIAKNIEKSLSGQELKEHQIGTRPMLVSLGDKYSIFAYGNHAIAGLFPALAKKLLESYIILRLRHL